MFILLYECGLGVMWALIWRGVHLVQLPVGTALRDV